jgi:hypothetical protein
MDDLDRAEIIAGFLKSGDYQSAESFAHSVEDEWQRAESLAHLARAMSSAGRLNEARRVWRVAIVVAQTGENSESMQKSLDSSSVLWEIAEDMALAGDIDDARHVAANIKNEHKRQRALSYVVEIASGGTGSFHKLRNNLPVSVESSDDA